MYLPEHRLREPLAISIEYRGGPCCQWVIKFRGITRSYDGAMALHDVLSDVSAARWSSVRRSTRK